MELKIKVVALMKITVAVFGFVVASHVFLIPVLCHMLASVICYV
jgi:hypothetical protein